MKDFKTSLINHHSNGRIILHSVFYFSQPLGCFPGHVQCKTHQSFLVENQFDSSIRQMTNWWIQYDKESHFEFAENVDDVVWWDIKITLPYRPIAKGTVFYEFLVMHLYHFISHGMWPWVIFRCIWQVWLVSMPTFLCPEKNREKG